MASANERLRDEAIRHALDFRQYTNGVVQRIVAVLNRGDARLFAELAEALDRLDPESFTVERLESMLVSVAQLNAQAYEAIGRELDGVLREYVAYETAYQRQMLASVLPVQVHVATVSAEQVYAAALARPFQGVFLRQVWPELGAQRMRLVRRAIAQGFVENRTTAQIVRDLRGTRAKGYADGLVQRSRRDIEAVVRTAMGHYSGFVADRTAEANSDLIKAVQWSATLDLRTSETCRVRDGKLYEPVTHQPIGHKLPWGGGPGRAHWNCRSDQVFITKSWRDMGVNMDEVPAGTRASMDGQVPAETSYGEWLKKQSAARQDQVLGPARGKLLREGKLTLEQMYSDKGRWLTLDELKERDAAAFRRAGL